MSNRLNWATKGQTSAHGWVRDCQMQRNLLRGQVPVLRTLIQMHTNTHRRECGRNHYTQKLTFKRFQLNTVSWNSEIQVKHHTNGILDCLACWFFSIFPLIESHIVSHKCNSECISLSSHTCGIIKNERSENLGLNPNQLFLVVQPWASYWTPGVPQSGWKDWTSCMKFLEKL